MGRKNHKFVSKRDFQIKVAILFVSFSRLFERGHNLQLTITLPRDRRVGLGGIRLGETFLNIRTRPLLY